MRWSRDGFADLDLSDVEVVTALSDVEPFADPLDKPIRVPRARVGGPSDARIEFALLVLIGWDRRADIAGVDNLDEAHLRACQDFCARGRFRSSGLEPVTEEHGELGLGLEPLTRRSFPFLGRVIENKDIAASLRRHHPGRGREYGRPCAA